MAEEKFIDIREHFRSEQSDKLIPSNVGIWFPLDIVMKFKSLVKDCMNQADMIMDTVIILNIGTDRSEQTVQTLIRLLLMEQSDQGLLCLLFCLHLLNTKLHCKIQLFQL